LSESTVPAVFGSVCADSDVCAATGPGAAPPPKKIIYAPKNITSTILTAIVLR